MFRLALAVLLAGFHLSSPGADRARRRAEERIERLGVFFEALQSDPARAVPRDILREAKGIVIVRETRAGLILGGSGGDGVALLQDHRGWTPPAIVKVREGGFGLQAGWQKATFVQVLMTPAAVEAMRTNRFRFGVDLRVTSGPRTLGDEAKTHPAGADVLVYADTGGLFGGLAMEGGTTSPDDDANRDLYGLTAEGILFERKAVPTEAGKVLIGHLSAPATVPGTREGHP